MSTKRTGKNPAATGHGLSQSRLDELVEDATTDAHDESEQVSGFYTMLDNDLHLPFETQILGVTATVELSLLSSPPQGAEWIVAYRYWRTGAV